MPPKKKHTHTHCYTLTLARYTIFKHKHTHTHIICIKNARSTRRARKQGAAQSRAHAARHRGEDLHRRRTADAHRSDSDDGRLQPGRLHRLSGVCTGPAEGGANVCPRGRAGFTTAAAPAATGAAVRPIGTAELTNNNPDGRYNVHFADTKHTQTFRTIPPHTNTSAHHCWQSRWFCVGARYVVVWFVRLHCYILFCVGITLCPYILTKSLQSNHWRVFVFIVLNYFRPPWNCYCFQFPKRLLKQIDSLPQWS